MIVGSGYVAKEDSIDALGFDMQRQVRTHKRTVLGRHQQGKTELAHEVLQDLRIGLFKVLGRIHVSSPSR